MKKIPKKYSGFLLGLLLPVVMGFIMSFVITALNLGFGEGFIGNWMHAYTGALVIGVPVAFIIVPPLKAFVDKITR